MYLNSSYWTSWVETISVVLILEMTTSAEHHSTTDVQMYRYYNNNVWAPPLCSRLANGTPGVKTKVTNC